MLSHTRQLTRVTRRRHSHHPPPRPPSACSRQQAPPSRRPRRPHQQRRWQLPPPCDSVRLPRSPPTSPVSAAALVRRRGSSGGNRREAPTGRIGCCGRESRRGTGRVICIGAHGTPHVGPCAHMTSAERDLEPPSLRSLFGATASSSSLFVPAALEGPAAPSPSPMRATHLSINSHAKSSTERPVREKRRERG